MLKGSTSDHVPGQPSLCFHNTLSSRRALSTAFRSSGLHAAERQHTCCSADSNRLSGILRPPDWQSITCIHTAGYLNGISKAFVLDLRCCRSPTGSIGEAGIELQHQGHAAANRRQLLLSIGSAALMARCSSSLPAQAGSAPFCLTGPAQAAVADALKAVAEKGKVGPIASTGYFVLTVRSASDVPSMCCMLTGQFSEISLPLHYSRNHHELFL